MLTKVITDDVERIELKCARCSFGVLILSEVLGARVDPEWTLRRLFSLHRPGGTVLASMANAAHRRVIYELSRDRPQRTVWGDFDRACLRGFTPCSFAALLETGGFRVDQVSPAHWSCRTSRWCRT